MSVEKIFKDKIESAAEPKIADNIIWDKIEAKLDKKPRTALVFWKMGLAASITILIGLGLYFTKKTNVIDERLVSERKKSKVKRKLLKLSI
jgi:hypothetical protein